MVLDGIGISSLQDPGVSNQYDPEYGEYKTFDRGEEADVWIKQADG